MKIPIPTGDRLESSELALRCRLASVSLLLLLGASACQQEQVRTMYANEYRCPDDQIDVGDLGGSRFRVRGCDRELVYQCIGNTCFPDHASEEAVTEPTPAAGGAPRRKSAASEEGVARREKSGDLQLVVLDLRLDDHSLLKLRAAPERNGAPVQIKLLRLDAGPDFAECNIDWMVNGQRLESPQAHFSAQTRVSALRSDVPRTVVRELSVAKQFAVRACELRWSLRPEQVAQVRHFIELYEEDIAWNEPERKGGTGGLAAPLGGWPEWKVSGAAPSPAGPEGALNAGALFKLLSPSVFQIEALLANGTSQGSAVAVSTSELLTNCHVVEGARKDHRGVVAAHRRSLSV